MSNNMKNFARTLMAELDAKPNAQTNVQNLQEHIQKQQETDSLANNIFAQTMNNEEITEKQRAEKVRDFLAATHGDPLTLRPEDLAAINETMQALETYHTSLQDKSIDTDVQAIRELMDRVKNAIAPEMKKMLEKLMSTNTNIQQVRDLLNVYKIAVVKGVPVKTLQDAVEAQIQYEKSIAIMKSTLEHFKLREKTYDERLIEAQAEYDALDKTFWGGLRVKTIGAPAAVLNKLENAQNGKATESKNIATTTAQLTELESKLQADLDTGSLMILRSFDITKENGLRDKIHASAQDTIDVIESIRTSVKTLQTRVANSEKAVSSAIEKIEHNSIDRTTLQSSLTEAYNINQQQADTVGASVANLQQALDDLPADSVDAGKARIDLMKQTSIHKGLLAYGERINTMLRLLKENSAASALSSNEAERTLDSVQNNKSGLNTLYNSTLPSLSEAMKMILHQFVDEQDQEFRMSINEVTKSLGNTTEGIAEHALEQQKQFHEQKIQGLRDLIGRLDTSASLLERGMQAGIEAATTEEKAYVDVNKSAENLREGVVAAGQVRAKVRERTKQIREETEATLSSEN